MNEEIYLLIHQYKNNKDDNSLLTLLDIFRPLIKKYSRKLNYDGAESDLIIYFIELLNKMPLNSSMNKNKYILSYINISIKNHYIKLSKYYHQIFDKETELNLEITSDILTNNNPYSNLENKLLLNLALSILPYNQKKIIIDKFFNEKSDVQISGELNISRQAVNKTKNKALNNMRNYLICY